MSDITTKIQEFNDGKITREELIEDLTTRTYKVPERMQNQPADAYEREAYIYAASPYTDGSFDEVYRQLDSGKLPKDIFMEVVGHVTAGGK